MRVFSWAIAGGVFLWAGCGGGGGGATSVSMTMTAASGLAPSDVGSVEILVLDGAMATCDRALAPPSPLDDPSLMVVAHALFNADGTAKHLSVPAGQHLVFYADAFKSPDGGRPRVGRGCSEGTLAAGSSVGVSIMLGAAADY